MARKKAYQPKPFESTGKSGDTSANLYDSMLESSAFMDLSKNQRLLYLYCKKQFYGKRKPAKDFPDIKELQVNEAFYFPIGTAVRYGLYKRGNHQGFYRDMQSLETHGFIKTLANGKETRSRSVYCYSDEWQRWEK